MTSEEYQTERMKRGKIADVARALNVSPQSIWNREQGKTPITREAELALLSLPVKEGIAI